VLTATPICNTILPTKKLIEGSENLPKKSSRVDIENPHLTEARRGDKKIGSDSAGRKFEPIAPRSGYEKSRVEAKNDLRWHPV